MTVRRDLQIDLFDVLDLLDVLELRGLLDLPRPLSGVGGV